jgi:hypothetical protein
VYYSGGKVAHEFERIHMSSEVELVRSVVLSTMSKSVLYRHPCRYARGSVTGSFMLMLMIVY